MYACLTILTKLTNAKCLMTTSRKNYGTSKPTRNPKLADINFIYCVSCRTICD